MDDLPRTGPAISRGMPRKVRSSRSGASYPARRGPTRGRNCRARFQSGEPSTGVGTSGIQEVTSAGISPANRSCGSIRRMVQCGQGENQPCDAHSGCGHPRGSRHCGRTPGSRRFRGLDTRASVKRFSYSPFPETPARRLGLGMLLIWAFRLPEWPRTI